MAPTSGEVLAARHALIDFAWLLPNDRIPKYLEAVDHLIEVAQDCAHEGGLLARGTR
jgi:hypothetical protein